MSDSQPCSEEFERAFVGSGGCVIECACGRVHFDTVNSFDWEQGELEGLEEQSRKEPDKYLAHNCSVQAMTLGGSELVCGCPCNRARKYEDFIINHASQIAAFLSARAKVLEQEAQAAVLAATLASSHISASRFSETVQAQIAKLNQKAA